MFSPFSNFELISTWNWEYQNFEKFEFFEFLIILNLVVEINNLLPSNVVAILCQLSNLFPVIDNMSVFEHEHPFSYQRKFALSTLLDHRKLLLFEIFSKLTIFCFWMRSSKKHLSGTTQDTCQRLVIHAASKINHAALFSHVLSDCSSVITYRSINAILTISRYRSMNLTELSSPWTVSSISTGLQFTFSTNWITK